MPGSVTVSRRRFSAAERLADNVATMPLSKVSQASASSTRPLTVAAPPAATDLTGDPASVSTRSMSWIIRSRMTSTSADAAPPGLAHGGDAAGIGEAPGQFADGRREALDVPDLENDACPLGALDKVFRRDAVDSERLLHEDMHAGIEEVAGNGVVKVAGRRSIRIDLADQGAMVGEGRRRVSAATASARAPSASATATSRASGWPA